MRKNVQMKIDLHVHTSEISNCGRLTCSEVVRLYSQAGYDAIVITNHFSRQEFSTFTGKGGTDFHKSYFDTIRLAEAEGKKHGLLVLGGMELRFDDSSNDYLVFGMTEELCRDMEKIFSMRPADFSLFAQEHGLLFYQAHPFRNGMKVVDPKLLFGIEICNTHPRHDSRNDIAAAWAEKYSLHQIGGSDCHQIQDVGSSFITTDQPLENSSDLLHILKNDLYTIGVSEK